MIRFGIKAGLAYGAVYYISEQGVWRSSDEASLILNKITDNVRPYAKEVTKHIPIEVPSLPPRNEIMYLMNYYWNRGVLASCKFLAELPSNASRLTNQGFEYISEKQEFKNLFNSSEQITSVKPVEESLALPRKK